MEYLVNADEMKQIDFATTEHFKVPSIVLMERAALETVSVMEEEGLDTKRTLVFCGTGNNGGDGAAVARLLFQKKRKVCVVLLQGKHGYSESMQLQLEILKAYGIPVCEKIPDDFSPTLIVDALFGVGLTREITGEAAHFITQMNQMAAPKLSIDIPSGVQATNGRILGTCVQADVTVTYAYAKVGMYLWPGSAACGRIFVREIGIDAKSWQKERPSVVSLTKEDLSLLPERTKHSNKGTYGRVLVIAGQKDMAGAAVFAGAAAYRMGCGLVKVMTPEENRVILQEKVPEAVLKTYPESEINETTFVNELQTVDAIVCGPGIGTSQVAQRIVELVLANAAVPVVFDADALNILATKQELLKQHKAEVIVTPHPGEMGRLCQEKTSVVEADRLKTARQFAEDYQVICVLKGEHTLTAVPEGEIYLNRSGNHGMATAGSGDVLSGVIGSLLAQKVPPYLAASLGVYLHGLAGDTMIKETGYGGLLASDLVTGLQKIQAELL